MDQNVSSYRIAIRGKKWYSSIITYFIDIAINNAWLLHCICNRKDQLDLLSVRRAIARAYLKRYANPPDIPKQERPNYTNENIANAFFNWGLILIFMYNSTVCLFITGLYIFVWKYSLFVYYRTVIYFMKLFLKKYRIFWKILKKTSWVFFSFWMLLNMLNIFSDFIIFIFIFSTILLRIQGGAHGERDII